METILLQLYEIIGMSILILDSLRRQPLTFVLLGICTINLSNCCSGFLLICLMPWLRNGKAKAGWVKNFKNTNLDLQLEEEGTLVEPNDLSEGNGILNTAEGS